MLTGPEASSDQGDHPSLPGRLLGRQGPPRDSDLCFTHEFHVTLLICFFQMRCFSVAVSLYIEEAQAVKGYGLLPLRIIAYGRVLS